MRNACERWIQGGLAVVLSGLLLTGAFAQDEDNNESNTSARTIVLEKGDEIPRDFTHRVGVGHFVEKMKKFVKEMPEKNKAKIFVEKFLNQNSGNYNDRIRRMVMFGPNGKKDGQEWDYRGGGEGGGGLKRIIPWKNGARHGTEKVFGVGNNHNRYLQKEIPWKNGTIHGTKKVYHPDGDVMAEVPYKNGQQHGKSRSYDDEGNVTQVVPYKNGKRHGTMVYYWSGTDQKKKVVPCENGKVDGTAKLYYRDGTLKAVMPFHEDALHGIVKRYDEEGELDRKRYYIDGEQVPQGVFKDRYEKK